MLIPIRYYSPRFYFFISNPTGALELPLKFYRASKIVFKDIIRPFRIEDSRGKM